jgi:uncharacterized protein (TIGR00730 family)
MDPTNPNNARQSRSQSYRLAVEDTDFLLRQEMRAMRFSLEYAKADLLLRDWGVRSTLIVFGSARVASPEQVAAAEAVPDTEPEVLARMRRQLPWYEGAREFGRIASERGGALAPRDRWHDNVIATGGGGGIMAAANRGAHEAGAPSIGFNITLPMEQLPNPWITPELSFRFHYFAMRKMHLAMRANALVVFPGGFGTFDELFEILTLTQTRKMKPVPIVLFDEGYWRRLLNFEALVEEGMIARDDLALFAFADSAEAIWARLEARGLGAG